MRNVLEDELLYVGQSIQLASFAALQQQHTTQPQYINTPILRNPDEKKRKN